MTICFVLSLIVCTVASLAVYGRLGATTQAVPDPARGERAARRAALGLRLRLGAIALAAAGVALEGIGLEARSTVGMVGWSASAFTAAVTIAGLLGLARAELAGLSRVALCIAAFGTLCSAFVGEADIFRTYDRWNAMAVLDAASDRGAVAALAVSLAGVAAGAAAAVGHARRRGARQLARRQAIRLAAVIAFSVAAVVGTARPAAETVEAMFGLAGLILAAQAAALVVLASMYAQLARQIRLVSAVDAF